MRSPVNGPDGAQRGLNGGVLAHPSTANSRTAPVKSISRGSPSPKSKPGSKPAAKPAAKSKPAKPAKASAPKKSPEPKAAKPPSKAAVPAKPAPPDPAKPARKGITIVNPKPMKKPRPKAAIVPVPPGVGGLMSRGAIRKPLIPSGPKASNATPLGLQRVETTETPVLKLKSPFGKKELERFRTILISKRAELVGDVNNMESQALKDQSGSLSNLPQHIAEQGSEAYEQSLALDLAAADRKLIKEIDDALQRIEDGTYGVCEITGKPIKPERLEELPWARYSIEAARELERRQMRA